MTLQTVTYGKVVLQNAKLLADSSVALHEIVGFDSCFLIVGFRQEKDFLSPVKVTLFLIMFQMKEGQVGFEVM